PEANDGDDLRYGLYHQSVAEFLAEPALMRKSKRVPNRFYLPPDTWHRCIADVYLGSDGSSGLPWKSWDEYGLRYVATHLAEASEGPDTDKRHADVSRLVQLVTDEDFQQTHFGRFGDLPSLRRDLEQAATSAAQDRDQSGMLLLSRAVFSLVAFR